MDDVDVTDVFAEMFRCQDYLKKTDETLWNLKDHRSDAPFLRQIFITMHEKYGFWCMDEMHGSDFLVFDRSEPLKTMIADGKSCDILDNHGRVRINRRVTLSGNGTLNILERFEQEELSFVVTHRNGRWLDVIVLETKHLNDHFKKWRKKLEKKIADGKNPSIHFVVSLSWYTSFGKIYPCPNTENIPRDYSKRKHKSSDLSGGSSDEAMEVD